MSSSPDRLAARYRGVVSLLATGASNSEIAAELHLALRTVEGYVSELKTLTAVSDRGRLILWCQQQDVTHDEKAGPLPPE